MGATHSSAAAMGAYVLSDCASWLNFGNKGGLTFMFSRDPVLFNQCAYLSVNPAKNPQLRNELAMALED